MAVNRQVLLASRPRGVPTTSNFRLHRGVIPTPGTGEVLVRTTHVSIDPYIRGRIDVRESFGPRSRIEIGAVIDGATVGQVVSTGDGRFQPGDTVLGANGWQEYGVQQGDALRRLDATSAPPSTALGILGMPGFTAFVGLHLIAGVRSGQTVAVAAAAGPVGSMVGQLARLAGARTVGIAGSQRKVEWLTSVGFDAAIDHRTPALTAALEEATPNGIDVYFESVGGEVLDAVLPRLNKAACIPVCGLASTYNDPVIADRTAASLLPHILYKQLRVEGFAYSDYVAGYAGEFLRRASSWFAQGLLRYREDVADGLENAPQAFIRLLTGKTFGKTLIRVSE